MPNAMDRFMAQKTGRPVMGYRYPDAPIDPQKQFELIQQQLVEQGRT